MNRFIFDLQRFSSTVTIASDASQTYDGVTYTATSDAVLNLDDDEQVSGIASGSVKATVTGATDSPTVTFDGSTAFDFSCTSSDSALQVKASGTSINYTGGQVTYSANGISGAGEVSATGYIANLLPFDVTLDIPESGMNLTFDTANSITTFSADETVNATLTFPESVATLIENIKPLLTTLLNVDEDTAKKLYAVVTKLVSSPTTGQVQGVHTWNQNDKKLTINQGSLLALNVLDYALSMTAEGGNVDGFSLFSQLTGDPAIGARFTPSTDENAGLNFSLAKSDSKIYDGLLNVTAGAIDIDIVNVKASVEKDTAVTMTLQDGSLAEFKFDNAASVTYSADKSGLAYLTFGENDGKLLMTIYRDDKPVFNVGMEINGSLTLDTDNQNVGMTKDTITTITIGDHTATINVTDDAGFKIGLSNDAITITPQEGDGSLNVSLAKGDETVFQNTVSVSNGSIIFNPATQEMTLTDGTAISFVINDNYTLTATASGDATSTLSLSTSGVTLTPSTDEDDGTLNLTLTGTSSGSLSANIKVLSGSFTLGESGALTVAKGTELQITFSDDYIVNFKATDDAGGTLSLGTDGITFAPGDGDGALELTVTRGDEKRTASLDVTGGSVTYKLDGSISLTKGTVVKNVFDDGNILTITANTDASGSIYFNPSGGLTITPSTADALNVVLSTDNLDVVNVSSITGSINYSGGIITASDGTKARISYYFGWESDLYTTGGTASIQFTDDRTIYTANEGSTFTVDYLDGTTTEIQSGSYADVYGETIEDYTELVSEGTTLRANDAEVVFTLEKAGNYNLNGMDITTSKDNVEVRLPDYNTVTFAADAGITYNGQEFSGDGIVSIINGNVTIGQIISNTTANTLISGSDGFDSISNSEANNVTITALGGNDTIINDHAYYPSIEGGDGNDSIIVQRGDHSYIDGGAGKDTILGDASNDWAMGGYATINGGDGDDYIDTGSSDSSSIMGGAGDDIIITSGNDSTLNGGAGDDIISLHGASVDNNIIEYETGSGNDIIYGLNETGIISLTTGAEYSTAVSGDDVLLTVGENIITVAGMSEVNVVNYELEPLEITNTASNTLVTGTILNDSISNRGSNVTIDAQAGKDIVFNFGAETSINGGAGDDSIYNEGADGSTIEGDYGDDYLWNNSANVLINGSYGNDTLYNSGDNVTVKPGGGNDSITNDGGKNFVVEYTGGNDTIAGFNENSTLQIVGASYASVASDNDLVLTVGDNMITLTDAASLDNVNIVSISKDDLDTATTLVTAVQYRTEAGYPVIAGIAFHPKEYHGDEPTNYANKETLTIESSDGLELSGVHYTPENSNDKWVIIIHGYGHNHKHMYPFAGFYLDNGYNVLMVDQRASGDSEGDWLTMGTAESADIALWTQKIASLNSDAKITLFGVSMGAATAMLTAARSDITNVTSLVEDCGYTNVVELINLLNKSIPLNQSQSAIDLMPSVSESLTGYSLNDAAPINSISAAKMPTLFITGTADTVVPVSMLTALYDASGAEVKETFSVEGATHGVAGLYDPIGYSNTVFRFVAEADEEGWNTSNITDDISLRGTKYNDTISNSGDNVTISTGEGNDTITSSGASVSIDAGTGENLVVFTDEADSNTVVLSGNTTVEGFKTGFGEGSDTVYIDGDPAGVEFKDGGLTFGNSTDSLALSGITTTSKVNIYHERRSVLNKGVFIAENDWYSVQSSDLSVGSGEEVYFVGTTAKSQVGVDFGGISSALNVTMDTAYEDSEDFVPGTTTWINSVYSLRGGAGNTTITGSKLSDTIIAGTGETTINAAAGDDIISLGSASALVQYSSGEGNDIIQGFNENSTLSINDTYTTTTSGNDVIVNVGEEAITLTDAATLSSVNIFEGDLPLNTVNVTSNVSIVGTKGNDSIENEVSASNVTIQALGGDDYIDNYSYNVTIEAGDGNDSIDNADFSTGNILINAGAGNDSIRNSSDETTINAGDGNDSIINSGEYYNVSIDAGAGNDYIVTYNYGVTVTGGTGDDTIYNDWNFTENAPNVPSDYYDEDGNYVQFNYTAGDGNDVIYGFNETDTLNISGGSYSTTKSGDDLIITVDDGKITLAGGATLSNPNIIGTKESSVKEIVAQLPAANNTSVVSASDTKAEPISLKGGDLAVIEATSAKVSVSAGNDDTIVSEGKNVTVNLKKNSNTRIYATGGKMTLQGYDPSKGAGFGTTYDDIFDAISNNNIYFNKGRLTIGSALVVDGDGKNNLVNFYDANGDLQKVAHTPQDGSLNLSSETADLIATATENSTLTSGKGSDSIFAYAGSHVDAGAGNNYIQIDTEERGANDDGITVALTSGKNTIANFSAGFNDTNDRLFVGVRDTIDFKFDGTQLKFYNNDELRGVISDIADSGSSVNFLVADAKSVMKMVAIQTGEAVTVEDELADYYRGEKSGVNFGNYEGNLSLNLGSQEQNIGAGEVLFTGINQITVGSGQNTLIGSSHSETLTSNADGTTEFIFSKGNGKDLIRNFNFEDDKISVGNETITAVNINSSGGVRMEISGDGSVTLEDAQGKNFKINNFVAQVDTNVIYDGEANYFVATQANAAISVGADVGDAEIWLDGSHGKTFVGDIRTIDASNATGKTSLAGNDLDNVIYGGSYNNNLWGGNGGNDLLQGGSGSNVFFYTNGNGEDTITGTKANDVVFLSEVSLEQLASTSVENNVATINFKDGGKLTINDASNCNFVMTQGDQSQLYKISGGQFIAG